MAPHGTSKPVAVVGSDPLKQRRRGNEAAVFTKVDEVHIEGARGGRFLGNVLVFEAAVYGVEIDGGFVFLLGCGVSEKKGKEGRRSLTRKAFPAESTFSWAFLAGSAFVT